MANNSHFAKFPQINLPRSRMKITFNHKLSMMHGYLTPIDCWPVVPGDSWDTKKIASLVHMSTPIVPFMDNVDMYVRIFYCPLRLLWRGSSSDENSFEKFMGANKGAGYQTVVPVFPNCNVGQVPATYTLNVGNLRLNLSHLLGKPVQTFGVGTANNRYLPKNLSVLKERMYYFIWNSYFRAEQVQAEEPIDFSDGVINSGIHVAKVLLTDSVNVSDDSFNVWSHSLKQVNKKHDYLTSVTLQPQYGPSTLLPLGNQAPIIATGTNASPALAIDTPLGLRNTYPVNAYDPITHITVKDGSNNGYGQLVADLSNATAASINSLRFAFAVQRYLERSNYGSNHFYEILAVHYGVTSPDARLQRPEYLGGFHYRINVDQVLNTTGKTDTDQTDLGKKGAVSVTADRHFGFTKAFTEPGYIMVCAYTKHDRTYSDMVLREDFKENRFEFYSPEFANVGDMEVYRFELDGKQTNDDLLGFQEAWAEYRYRPSRVSGDLNPGVTGSMPYWSLADHYNTVPQFGPVWMAERRTELARALATGLNGPDFLTDWYIESIATRLMPVYSIPGLIDHVGSM